MIIQVDDTLLLEGDSYTLIGCSGELVHPRQFHMTPLPLHAACTRGWFCSFEIEGTYRGYAMRDGRYVDAYAMARLHPDPPQIGAATATA